MLHERVSKLSLAIQLKPEFPTEAVGSVGVFASGKGRRFQAQRNSSGFFVFNELPPGNYVVQVRPELFLDEDRPVSLPLKGAHGPVLQVQLKPRWRFPFAAGATLVRGSVHGPDGPVPAATVRLRGSALESRTDHDGRFVLRFPPAKEEALSSAGFMKASDGATVFQLSITHPDYRAKTVAVKDIAEGGLTTIRKVIELVRA